MTCSFCTVFFLYITELCILKAQQIQNMIKEYKCRTLKQVRVVVFYTPVVL